MTKKLTFKGFAMILIAALVAVMVAELVYLWASSSKKVKRVKEEPTYVEKVMGRSGYRVTVDTVEVDGQVYVVAVSSTGLSIIPAASCNCIER